MIAENDVAVAGQTVEADKGNVQAAEQNVAAARDAVRSVSQTEAYLTISAPFDGVVPSYSLEAFLMWHGGGSLEHSKVHVATLETKCHRTAKAVAWLCSNYEKPLRVEHLATIAGMSRSTLHYHFRALTAMSPLQFQNQLRLHAARQRMLTKELDAASAAFEVG